MKSKTDLSTLPLHFVKSGRHFFVNTKTGQRIPKSKIMDYLPEVIQAKDEAIRTKRWDLKLDNY